MKHKYYLWNVVLIVEFTIFGILSPTINIFKNQYFLVSVILTFYTQLNFDLMCFEFSRLGNKKEAFKHIISRQIQDVLKMLSSMIFLLMIRNILLSLIYRDSSMIGLSIEQLYNGILMMIALVSYVPLFVMVSSRKIRFSFIALLFIAVVIYSVNNQMGSNKIWFALTPLQIFFAFDSVKMFPILLIKCASIAIPIYYFSWFVYRREDVCCVSN